MLAELLKVKPKGGFSLKVFIFLSLAIFSITACTTGPMNIREIHYFAAPNGENTNYYRLRVEANTRLGVAGYRSGWFPADAVDYAFGDVSTTGGTEALKIRNKIKEQINEKILQTNLAWLDAAAKPDAKIDKLNGLLQARRRVLAYPINDKPPYEGASEIEYNPAKNVNIRFSDDKLIFVLSSDPDTVVANIASFSENQETALAIDRLAGVIAQRARNEIIAAEAVGEVNKKIDNLIFKQINLAQGVAASPETKIAAAIDEINTLLILLEGMSP
jgi:hypothetical protein